MSIPELSAFQSFPMDTLEAKKSYLVVGKNGSQVRLSSSAYQLLQAVDAGTSFDELAQQINQVQGESAISKEQLEQAYQELVRTLNEIDDRAQKGRLPWAFWIRLRLIPERWVVLISSRLSVLYQPHLSAVLLLTMVVAFVSLFHRGMRLDLNESSFLWGYLLYLLSLIVHEFGHSSACARYGAQPSDIGFAVYLIYPAFYSDVSSAWRLRRWQRVVVDLGGNYFQFLAGSCFIFAFYGTHWDAFRLAVLMIVSTALFSLNPIFKFDGYWVLADFLGVTNLASQPARIGTFFYNRMLRRATKPLPWPTRVASVLIIYSVISMIVWAVFFWHVAPMLWRRVISLSHSISIIRVYLESGHPPPWMEFRSFLISMFFLVISVAMLWQMAKRVANAVSRWSPYFLKKLTERHSLAQPESVRPKL